MSNLPSPEHIVDANELVENTSPRSVDPRVAIVNLRQMAQSAIDVGRKSRANRSGRTASRFGRRGQALNDAADILERLSIEHADLLEALKALWDETVQSGNGMAGDFNWPSVRARTIAAIAKAEGR